MKIIKNAETKWQKKKGYSKKILLEEKELRKSGGLVQEIKIKAGETAKIHHHQKQTEIFYFLTANGYWIINGEKKTFKIGDVLVIEPFDKHEVINDSNKDYIYLAFKYDYNPNDFYWD